MVAGKEKERERKEEIGIAKALAPFCTLFRGMRETRIFFFLRRTISHYLANFCARGSYERLRKVKYEK